ncbi:hypothetical protein CCUS01_01876 [Colletotrichum cuscutae]|uniref:Uncharacterized protein n=1 Tax=Colletotrichum cuscutae TaxID=1209917 RepID=A0AAI9XLY9_9PEZI|nr:hypothetical protein CCUS01_01876 [Colletotrichum cuscutae]
MIQEPEQESLRAKLIGLGRRYIHLSSHHPTIWEYEEGPVALGSFLRNMTEESSQPQVQDYSWRYLQRKSMERVVIDNRTLWSSFQPEVFNPDTSKLLRLDDDQADNEQSGLSGSDWLYLICRNRISAFLLGSDILASDLNVSNLREIHWTPDLVFPRYVDAGLFRSLILKHVVTRGKGALQRLCRGVRSAGLLLLLHGPQSATRKVANSQSIVPELHFYEEKANHL